MTKEEMLLKIGKLEADIKSANDRDEVVRMNLSGFLGSFKPANYYDHSRDIKVLQWSGIYFELGKIMADKNRAESLDIALREIEVLNKKFEVFKKQEEEIIKG